LACEGTVSADPALTAGFVITTADGVYDVTLDRLIAERRADLEMKVAEVLSA
jgi:hypothetical protein